MSSEKLRLQIITPDCVKYDDECDMVILRCTTGDMGILPKHEACVAILDYGVLRILNDGEERRMAVYGGIAKIWDDMATVLVNGAQWPEDIDRADAEAEREKAERRLQESLDDVQLQKEHILMRRTLVQIEVSSYPLIGKAER
ncbi:MAG: ATP synthase F1 subunit epsilon [Oscillospiraceae bacterium]|nr:ATP synthase F1 subunit epsilon [Oscillospiraceae bacterium]